FVNKAQWDADRNIATKLVDKWRRDVESKDATQLMSNYSPQFKSDHGENLSVWFTKHQQLLTGVKNLSIKLKDVTFFRYPGHEEMIVGTFTQESLIGKSKNSVRKRQYWAKDGTQWRIISEANL
ncbi:MAG: L,D-transpeptidase Cds6 family protein, partial [Burkholderiaceae bacterium]